MQSPWLTCIKLADAINEFFISTVAKVDPATLAELTDNYSSKF